MEGIREPGDLGSRLGTLLGVPVRSLRVAGTQHGYRHVTATLADGRNVFAKAAAGGGQTRQTGPRRQAGQRPDSAEAFAAEANGLRWLAEAGSAAGGPPVPRVLGVDESMLVIELLPPGGPSPEAASELGAALARMHDAGAAAGFGAPWPGYIASLPLDNTVPAPDAGTDWASWYAERRLVPYLKMARDGGAASRADLRPVETVVRRIGELAGPPEPPSRIHGDLWSGNVLWSGGHGWLIDPAAHGGHRETDLAMLALFGAPYLGEILRAYTGTRPLADGWQARVPLHQLHPLLVHVCLFGTSYTDRLTAAARAALRG